LAVKLGKQDLMICFLLEFLHLPLTSKISANFRDSNSLLLYVFISDRSVKQLQQK